ncbi:hypothetical protein EDB81DRAFT_75097 [Dactylonectria macrodidyma]|uniref:C2H2-type domain-containing protein n=1 Tax=Dactylonectria macrodidyma TaxID=307937 RepID=A0A9P9EIP6_9HYPO|nr:hypothetical protein EDB81DRAFT_75097 [Dactylonectria macrodidyma]
MPLHSYDTLVYVWPARRTYPSQPEHLEAIRAKYMLRGCHSPLSELVELKAFGKSIIKQEGPRGNLTWALEGRSFTIGDDKVVRLSEFCATYQAAIAQVRELVAEMMLGWEPTVDLSTIRDDLTCRQPGWCFLDKPENNLAGTYKAMARRAWSSSFRGQALAKAGHWLPGPCLAYLGAGVELTAMGLSASHVTAGLPGRGTETTSIRFRNTKLAIRNVFICEGRVIVIISYNKARASNNHAFYVVRYLPDDLDSSMFLYLAYIRPFLDFLANQLELPQYHSNEFLFPDPKHKKRHLTSTQATAALRSLTQDLQTPWTISLYRQAAIAIAKRHISDLIKKRNFYYPSDASTPVRMIAAGVGHHPRTLLKDYAIDRALPAWLQPELLEMYRQLSTLWQSWNQQYYEEYCLAGGSHVVKDGDAVDDSAERGRCLADAAAPDPGWRNKRPASPSSSEMARKKRKGLNISSSSSGYLTPGAAATEPPKGFIYNAEYQILICVTCESIIHPGRRSFYQHLNRKHRLMGPACKAYMERLSILQLRPLKELAVPRGKVAAIPGLRVHKAFRCNVCPYFTTRWAKILDHISTHKLGVSLQIAWEMGKMGKCYVQTFSSAKGLIVYFEATPLPSPAC